MAPVPRPLTWFPMPEGSIERMGVLRNYDAKKHALGLLQIAKDNLRCMEGKDLTREIMSGSSSANDKNVKELSRGVFFPERIDYFMSHSWHDNAEVSLGSAPYVCIRAVGVFSSLVVILTHGLSRVSVLRLHSLNGPC